MLQPQTSYVNISTVVCVRQSRLCSERTRPSRKWQQLVSWPSEAKLLINDENSFRGSLTGLALSAAPRRKWLKWLESRQSKNGFQCSTTTQSCNKSSVSLCPHYLFMAPVSFFCFVLLCSVYLSPSFGSISNSAQRAHFFGSSSFWGISLFTVFPRLRWKHCYFFSDCALIVVLQSDVASLP